MSIWFLTDHIRLQRERSEMENLQASEKWLLGVKWDVYSQLVVDADIEAHGHLYQVRLTYPTFFPDTPPFVTPINSDERWSTHQYGNGTLCLEWGPDNWSPEITGAQMLESTYKLLVTENPLGRTKEHGEVDTRHFLTPGQSLRSRIFRFYITPTIMDYLSNYERGSISEATLIYVLGVSTVGVSSIVYHVQKIGEFVNENLSGAFERGYAKEQWTVYCTAATNEQISCIKTIQDLKDLINSIDNLQLSPSIGTEQKGIILLNGGTLPHIFYFSSDQSLLQVAIIKDDGSMRRTPEMFNRLSEKKIAIVGVGSVGSKVAESLCRMGANQFYIVDEDLFLLGNIERNSLDWRDVGFHKVHAVAQKLRYLSLNVQVETNIINLTGQESNALVNGALIQISNCDVIIDATANGQVFNLLAAISTRKQKPLVWAEIYAGGIGGLIARSRPGRDPNPNIMRQAYQHFTLDTPIFELYATAPYVIQNDDGEVLVASDADVSVISSHLVRLIVDTVLSNGDSSFPYSMYLIGLSKGWIFSQPFDTKPIQTDHLIQEWTTDQVDDAIRDNNIAFIKAILENDHD